MYFILFVFGINKNNNNNDIKNININSVICFIIIILLSILFTFLFPSLYFFECDTPACINANNTNPNLIIIATNTKLVNQKEILDLDIHFLYKKNEFNCLLFFTKIQKKFIIMGLCYSKQQNSNNAINANNSNNSNNINANALPKTENISPDMSLMRISPSNINNSPVRNLKTPDVISVRKPLSFDDYPKNTNKSNINKSNEFKQHPKGVIKSFYTPLSDTAFVSKVYDGDSITVITGLASPYNQVDKNKYEFKIRLNGIDCPEMKSNDENEKKIAKKAQMHLQSRILSQFVELRNIPEKQTDKYGRILADVYLDNVCLNDEMIEKHLAVKYDGKTKKEIDWLEYNNRYNSKYDNVEYILDYSNKSNKTNQIE